MKFPTLLDFRSVLFFIFWFYLNFDFFQLFNTLKINPALQSTEKVETNIVLWGNKEPNASIRADSRSRYDLKASCQALLLLRDLQCMASCALNCHGHLVHSYRFYTTEFLLHYLYAPCSTYVMMWESHFWRWHSLCDLAYATTCSASTYLISEATMTAVIVFSSSYVPSKVISDYNNIFRRDLCCHLVRQSAKRLILRLPSRVTVL